MAGKLRALPWAAAILASSAMMAMAEGDPEAGRNVYVTTCYSCHAMECDRNGPALADLYGRPAGSSPDFPYTDAMKQSGIVWDAANLDAFLADTDAAVPGTRMWQHQQRGR
jgi:cytochrome c